VYDIATRLLIGLVLASCGLAVFACDVPGGGNGILRPAAERTTEEVAARELGEGLHDAAALDRLDPDLLEAVLAAAGDAAADGVDLRVTSGWRSREHQARLFEEALTTYGSAEEASRWVASPESSAHVTGDAVDIGPTDGALWMGQHGAAYGLCQTYANEIWHFELLTSPGGACPEMLPDGTVER
jgi:D-alanyl-D-alanine carboxypeptidase